MSPRQKFHSPRCIGDIIYHKITGEKGVIVTVTFYHDGRLAYGVAYGAKAWDTSSPVEIQSEKPPFDGAEEAGKDV